MTIDVQAFLASLPIMGLGMLGIFIVIIAIMLAVKIMSYLTAPKNKEE